MDSHVYSKASYRLPALADLAVLRFNTRGHLSARGTSEGAFDDADGERFDVAAAIEYAEFHDAARTAGCVGWSFGTDLALMYGYDPAVAGRSCSARRCGSARRSTWRSGPSPASRWSPWCPSSTTTCARRRPRSGSPRSRRPRWSASTGAKHLWVGEPSACLDEIVARVAPGRGAAAAHLARRDDARAESIGYVADTHR